MFQTLTVEKQIRSIFFISQVNLHIWIVEDFALNRNIHSTQIFILWHSQNNIKNSESKDVKGQGQSVFRPLLFKCYLWTRHLVINWDLVRSTDSQVHLRTSESEATFDKITE